MQAQETASPVARGGRRKALGPNGHDTRAQRVNGAVEPRKPMKISDEAWARARVKRGQVASDERNPFEPYKPIEGVVPAGHGMAMDDAGIIAGTAWANSSFGSIYAEGQTFMGYPELALLAQRPEYRVISETIATEMTRKWIEIKVKSNEDEEQKEEERTDWLGHPIHAWRGDRQKHEKIARITEEFERLNVRDAFRKLAEQDGFFGRAHLYLDTGDTEDRVELATNLGDGRNAASRGKVSPQRRLRAVKTVEAVWTYPTTYNATDPLSDDWYKPNVWYAMGKQIHASRLLTFVGREVPDLLKPAYAFGGLSLSQMAKPYVDNWLVTRQSVQDIIKSFSVFVLKTNMQALMGGAGGDDFFKRLDVFNATRDNRGIMAIDKEVEDFANVSAPLSGLDHLQAQAQEHMCLQRGTLIETERGQVPVENVTIHDRVITRNGSAPVKWVGVTGKASRFTEIRTEDSVLRTTECHPVWSETAQDFVSAKNVDLSHRLLRSHGWANTAHRSSGAAAIGGTLRKAITATKKQAACFIASCGKRIADLSRKVSTFITATKTERTIAGTTWSYSTAPDISVNTLSRILSSSQNGVRFVGQTSNQVTIGHNIALERARRALTRSAADGNHSALTSSLAENAAQNLRRDIELRSSVPTHACSTHVSTISTLTYPEEQDVFNIQVEDGYLPEYFANGLLVHNCSVSRIPLVKLTGISPSGLNASSDGELRVFEDVIHAYQEAFFRPNLTRILGFVQLSLFGEVDDEIIFDFLPINELTEKEKAELRKIEADTGQILVEVGAISQEEERKRVANDPDTPYAGIDVDDMPDLGGEEAMGLEPQGGHEHGGGEKGEAGAEEGEDSGGQGGGGWLGKDESLAEDAREYKRDEDGKFAETNSGGGKSAKPKAAKKEKAAKPPKPITPFQYAQKERGEGRFPNMPIQAIAGKHYLHDNDWNLLSGKGYESVEAAERDRSKILDRKAPPKKEKAPAKPKAESKPKAKEAPPKPKKEKAPPKPKAEKKEKAKPVKPKAEASPVKSEIKRAPSKSIGSHFPKQTAEERAETDAMLASIARSSTKPNAEPKAKKAKPSSAA